MCGDGVPGGCTAAGAPAGAGPGSAGTGPGSTPSTRWGRRAVAGTASPRNCPGSKHQPHFLPPGNGSASPDTFHRNVGRGGELASGGLTSACWCRTARAPTRPRCSPHSPGRTARTPPPPPAGRCTADPRSCPRLVCGSAPSDPACRWRCSRPTAMCQFVRNPWRTVKYETDRTPAAPPAVHRALGHRAGLLFSLSCWRAAALPGARRVLVHYFRRFTTDSSFLRTSSRTKTLKDEKYQCSKTILFWMK